MNALALWNSILADLLVNLSAGWLGAVLIVPNFSKETGLRKLWVLTGDLVMGILSLLLAFKLRNL
ncbi:MAG: hypothetical protein U0946_02820 [Patescibacteria group bacterium]|nr:hypothetical protein [Patescibacteria group bacterium]